MGELLAQLVPEIIGLAATPAAIVACLLLLGSHRPYRNVAVFGGTVLVLYSILGAIALAAGRSTGAQATEEATTVRDWIGLVVGLLFLVGGGCSRSSGGRRHGPREQPSSFRPGRGSWPHRMCPPSWASRSCSRS